MLFRSEEHLENWRSTHREHQGETLPLAQLWDLAAAWYHNRLDPDFTGRTIPEVQGIFRKVGLTSPFWLAEG